MIEGFYTSVVRNRNKIRYRGYDESGLAVQREFDYKPRIFLEARGEDEVQWKSLYGVPLKPLRFDSMSEMRQYMKQYEDVSGYKIWGNQNHVAGFIQSQWPDTVPFKPDDINVLCFDIETAFDDEHGYSEPCDATNEILTITVKSTRSDTYVMWGMKDYDPTAKAAKHLKIEYRRFPTERSMLNDFIGWWREPRNMPDVLTGWNINGYDIPYLVNRISRIFDPETAQSMSPWGRIDSNTYTRFGNEETEYTFVGISNLDYIDLYKKFTYTPRESYSLDSIAQAELDVGKLEFSGSLADLYDADFQKYCDYNAIDVERVNQIDEKLGLLKLVFQMAYYAGTTYDKTLGTVGIWDTIIMRELARRKIAVEPKRRNFQETFPGGYVKIPVPGMYEHVMSFDLASLYPNIIIQYNMSPEKLTPEVEVDGLTPEKILEGKAIPRDHSMEGRYAIAANGAAFRKDSQGFIPSIVESLYNGRVEVKQRMLALKREKEELKLKLKEYG